MAATEEERNRLAVILSSIPDALLISDAGGVIRIASAASRKFFGDVPLPGKQFVEVVRDREFLSLLDGVRQDHMPGVAEFTLEHPEERHCVARVSPLSYREGEVSGFIAIFHDITQLKKLEQVRKDFVANISHEIKTPITAIGGFADTLLEGALDDREHARKFVETIKANSRRINSLVDDLMTISKLELGVIKVEKSAIAFEDAADAALTMLQVKAQEKNITLKTAVPHDLGTIQADRDRLVQILTNLVDNAIKFTPEGGSVQVGIRPVSEPAAIQSAIGIPQPAFEITVEDTGIGIPEKHLSRLGERFYRVDTARSRNMGGTGLGLAIVKHLVKAHGWDMQIESAVGKGTKVRIFIA
jgi:two-component system phosphate regulon sensor histidine kinase PhoR